MIIPQFWAECRLQHKDGRKQITVRRFGWSDTDQTEAQEMANVRASDALQRLIRGEKIPRREIKETYGGADGLPIREEIVRRDGVTIISRNSYGALCLNTPDVMFVDLDVDETQRYRMSCGLATGIILTSMAVAYWQQQHSLICLAIGFLIGHLALKLMNAIDQRVSPSPWDRCRSRIAAFSETHPNWHLRLYRTPAGYRVLVMHALFEPRSQEAEIVFEAMGADPVYVQMCVNQCCFRARVSPKPWRIGMDRHLKPRPGVWPVKPEQMERRQQWVRDYEAKATEFAACAFVESLGSSTVHPATEAVRSLHDEMCRTTSGLPLA